MKSLRFQLTLFWTLLFALCAALALVMTFLYRTSSGVQIEVGKSTTEQTCRAIAARYAKSIPASAAGNPRIDLLQVLLQLVLLEAPQVEGGIWKADDGLIAYAYPTYQGSGIKRDIPQAEQPLIIEMSQQATRSQEAQTDVVKGNREALVISSCPLASSGKDLAAWTMTRTASGALEAQTSIRIGMSVLLLLIVLSGVWLGAILFRGLRKIEKVETQFANAENSVMPQLESTGLRELDRIVAGFNLYRARFEESQRMLKEAAAQSHRDQRLASLGRMTGSIAHEIRNPIAAMRLKAENALAASSATMDGSKDQSLRSILGQIERLDGLVKSLLSLVQPIVLNEQLVDLHRWLEERLAVVASHAAEKRIALDLVHTEPNTAVFDPIHMARALDNLLANAVRHTAASGRIVLSAFTTECNSLIVRVDDNGEGVPDALRATLFEPFATGRADGTGLGLALSREVAFAHGGDLKYTPLDAQTAAAAGGSRFEMEIPWRAS